MSDRRLEEQEYGVDVGMTAVDVFPLGAPLKGAKELLAKGSQTLVDTGGNVIRAGTTDFKIQKLHGALASDSRALEFVQELKDAGVSPLRAYEVAAKSKGKLPADYGPITPAAAAAPVDKPLGYGGTFSPDHVQGIGAGPIYRRPDGTLIPQAEVDALDRAGANRAGPHQEIRELNPGHLTQSYGPTLTNPSVSPDLHVAQQDHWRHRPGPPAG